MKPNFALDLSHDGISLLHRGISGWSLVGEVALDDPLMGSHLAELRRTAAELESGGVTTKLIIPNSQLLYVTLEAPGPDDISREVQIRAALEGLTPYEVGDLVFDWRAEGERARVAVLARETMDEAENFAVEHRFNPVSFVARPDSGDFSGEPFFGKTRAATRILPPGERLVPDTSPVPRRPRAMPLSAETRVEDDAPPAPQAAPSPAPQPASEPVQSWKRELPDPFAGFDDDDEPTPAQDSPPEADRDTAPEPDEPPAPDPAPEAPAATPTPSRKTRAVPRRPKASERGEKGVTPVLAPFPPTPDEVDERPRAAPVETPDDTPAGAKPSTRAGGRGETGTTDRAPEPKEQPRRTAPAGPVPWSGQETPAPREPVAPPPLPLPDRDADADTAKPVARPPLPFHTRRDPAAAEAGPDAAPRPIDFGPRSNGATKSAASDGWPMAPRADRATESGPQGDAPRRVDLPDTPPPKLDSLRAGMADALTKPLPTPDKPFGKTRSGGLRGLGGAFGKLRRRGKSDGDSAADAGGKTDDKAHDKAPAKETRTPAAKPTPAPTPATPPTPTPAAAATAPAPEVKSAPPGKPAATTKPAATIKPAAVEKPRSEAEAMTVFGARRSKDLERRPRYLGVILTLGLILVMAIIALWSTVFDPGEDVTLFNPGSDVEVVPGTGPTAEAPPAGGETGTEGSDGNPETVPSPTDPPAPETQPASSAPPVVDPAAIETAVTEAQPPAAPVTGEVLSPEAAEARYAATGIWQRAPEPMADPSGARIDVPDPAALDPIAAVQEVPALPAAGAAGEETLPPNTMAPPPPGTSFTLNEAGLVVATPEGTVAPSGILVYAGRPAVLPPARPPEAGAPRAEGVPRVKPVPRPANLTIPTDPALPDPPVPAATAPETPATPDAPDAPDAPPETPQSPEAAAPEDGAALDLPGTEPDAPGAEPDAPDTELAVITPRARPEDLVVATSNAPDGGLIDAAVDDVIDAAFADASELAVARSIPPQHRPDNFAAIVDSVREAMSDGSRVAAAPAAPAATAAPVIPASANVAARATVENALNLRAVNLIGIYGGSNSRRALVRLENGRYVKVKVGDRLDGGQVTSITASQLTYQKGRKVYALEVLPLG
ncbi:hypothetical protein [Maritimibacter fusiformis]|uniref:Uncharacterized protein n=1 Tax=Maritimibacter fusiformis TaxID=2603819 RepID=A0A5D0RQP4_9RHOB|nr:hypothetical protein [Maritimibacter fusiformis]TYB82891.1 hypothetical protein FVF75_01525 [Maritimibacter fusiformis]